MTEGEAVTTEGQRCRATRLDGSICRGLPDASGFCVGHRPGATEARARGGKNSSTRARIERRMDGRLRPILTLLAVSIQECHDQKIPASVASGMASLATAMIRLDEYAALTARVESLEVQVKQALEKMKR